MTQTEPTYTPEQLKLALSLCGNECLAGNVRSVAEYIALMESRVLQLEQSVRDHQEHTAALDNNWQKLHDLALDTIRMALELPDASIPELVQRINQLKERAGVGVAHDARICPCGICEELRRDPPRLRVWHDDEESYAIAYSRLDLSAVLSEQDITMTDEWFEIAPRARIKIRVYLSSGEIVPADEPNDSDRIGTVELTASDWIERRGRGFLCTSEY